MGLFARGESNAGRRVTEEPEIRDFLRSIRRSGERVFSLRQIHSHKVLIDDGDDPARISLLEGDGLLSRGSSPCLLTVTVADCLPVYLWDSRRGGFGIIHSGWRGTGIVREAIRIMGEAFGTAARDLCVTIGPGIGPCCYEVSEERYNAFRAEFGEEAVRRHGTGRFFLDLVSANLGMLREAGVATVLSVEQCTACTGELGSFRRQGPRGFTRMLAFIGKGGKHDPSATIQRADPGAWRHARNFQGA
jgi:YfiH family protein